MPLPKIEHPMYRVVLPSNKKEVFVRPYTTREQKILNMLSEAETYDSLFKNIQALVENCVVEPKDFDSNKITIFDLQYIFLQLRCFSVDEKAYVKMKCQHKLPNGEVCDKENDLTIPLKNITVKFYPDVKQEIVFPEKNIGIKLRYPMVQDIHKLDFNREDFDMILDIIADDVEAVFDKEKTYTDFTKEEVKAFLNELRLNDFEKILLFYDKIPHLYYSETVVCSNCKNETKLEFNSLADFFA